MYIAHVAGVSWGSALLLWAGFAHISGIGRLWLIWAGHSQDRWEVSSTALFPMSGWPAQGRPHGMAKGAGERIPEPEPVLSSYLPQVG